jgi:hypothetical protein
MNPLDQLCDTIQQEISSSLDEGLPLSTEIIQHADNCENCAEFVAFSSGGAMSLLAEPLPPAGIALREEILSLSQTARAVTVASHPSPTAARRGREILSAIAAVIVISCCGYWLIDVHPAGTAASTRVASILPIGKLAAAKEFLALENDFHQGFAELNEPISSIQSLLNQ